jgi:cellulose biosynthesis protein BcsQ
VRKSRGRLIAVWTPGNHGSGGSTITIAVAVTMQHLTNKRILAINMGSARNFMEQYFKHDAEARFSMDYLKSFDAGITAEQILTYSSAINEQLYVLPKCKIDARVNKVGGDFFKQLLDKALEIFDYVFIDVEAGIDAEKQRLLDQGDIVLAVMEENPIILEELLDSNVSLRTYLRMEKTIPVFNQLQLSHNTSNALSKLNKHLGLNSSFGIAFDIGLNRAACCEGKLYSYVKKELSKKKPDVLLIQQLVELCQLISDKLLQPLEVAEEKTGYISMLLSRARLRGEVDV